jgi:aspartate 1-decarboxylase
MMLVTILQAKIHRATVTDSNLNYDGSITVDTELLAQAGLVAFQQVQIYNIANGQRFETYLMNGRPNSGEIVINGAAARLVAIGDLIIIAAYALVSPDQAAAWQPKVVLVDAANKARAPA